MLTFMHFFLERISLNFFRLCLHISADCSSAEMLYAFSIEILIDFRTAEFPPQIFMAEIFG